MKVLLTGANGFLGSHVLDVLVEAGHEVSLLLRRACDTTVIASHVEAGIRVHHGSFAAREDALRAVEGVEAVVHCAGKTKALDAREFFAVNEAGTRQLLEAVNARRDSIRRFVLLSSLAAGGPGWPEHPVRESDPPRPVSAYGRSKLAGEEVVRNECAVPWTILRPGPIYGPRDVDFLGILRMARKGVVPLPGGRHQAVSMIYGRDTADGVHACLRNERAENRLYNIAAEPPHTASDIAHAIAQVLGRRVREVPVPGPVLYAACIIEDWRARLRGAPQIVSRLKWPELRARGWVCATDRIREELGFTATTSLGEGLGKTVSWYESEGSL